MWKRICLFFWLSNINENAHIKSIEDRKKEEKNSVYWIKLYNQAIQSLYQKI